MIVLGGDGETKEGNGNDKEGSNGRSSILNIAFIRRESHLGIMSDPRTHNQASNYLPNLELSAHFVPSSQCNPRTGSLHMVSVCKVDVGGYFRKRWIAIITRTLMTTVYERRLFCCTVLPRNKP